MSKDTVIAIAAGGSVLALLLGAAAIIGGIQTELTAQKRTSAALQADNREIRGMVFQHLENHSPLAKEAAE